MARQFAFLFLHTHQMHIYLVYTRYEGRGCMDQVFAVRQVCEKYLAIGKDLFWAFMDLEKAYDTSDRHGMWQMLKVYGVGGKLLKAVQSFM